METPGGSPMPDLTRLTVPTLAPAVCALGLALAACGGSQGTATPAPASPAAAASATPTPEPSEEPLEPAPEATPLPVGLPALVEPFKGDLDGMMKRRVIRVLTVQNPILYYVDKGREVGATYESIKAFEKQLNDKARNKVVTVHVIPIPVARAQLIPRLLAGQGDIVAANFTITPERQKLVNFGAPFAENVQEVLVTGPASPPIASVDDLPGKEFYVRPSSSYAEHLRAYN